jgi:ATP-dependent helicase/nuclease subunit A
MSDHAEDREPLPDDAHRHDIVTQLGHTLFVEAGAGTGKTSSLVGRVLALLEAGGSIDDLAVITFTEAAAAELRDRIRRDLDASDAPWARTAVAELDGAAISTLHGFAQRILSENPLQAGLPPVIDVHGEIGAQVDFERRWRVHLDHLLDDDTSAELVQRAIVLGIELRHLRALAAILENEWDHIPDDHVWTPPQLAPVSLDSVLEPLRQVDQLVPSCHNPDDSLLAIIDGFAPWRARAERATSDLEKLDLLNDIELKHSRRGRKPDWAGDCLAQVRDLIDSAEAARQALVAARVDEVLSSLVANLCTFTTAGVAERIRDGRLQFHDLLVLCRRLLQRSSDVRARLHDRYRYLLIDEFQDTDPIQIEIARLIATSITDVEGADWRTITADAGRLFFVGDAKQSIYRFRRADISLFLSVRDADDTEARTLSTNFRTVPGIVDWVNHTFTEIMGEGTPGAQPRYEPLHAQRGPGPDPGPPVVVLGGPQDIKGASDRRRAAYDELATGLRAVVDDGWQVQDRHTEEWRTAAWDDIAVLIPARTGLPEMRAAFDAHDVPYRIEASSLVWLTQEVTDLLSVLRAIDDPADEIALLASLRSPGFACGDDDLAEYVAAGGGLDLDRDIPGELPEGHRVAAAIRSLQQLRGAAVWDEPSALVERVIRERHLMELALASTRPRDVWRRLRFVADQARAYVDSEGGTLRDFLAWTDLQADEMARVTESILPETDDVAVRVMTIHASKGLEFPVVALAGLDRRPHEKRYAPNLLWNGETFGAHLRSGMRTSDYATLEEADDAHEVHEGWRLMYVAATRARDHLIVCLHRHPTRGADSIAARFDQLGAARPDLWRSLEVDTTTSAPRDVAATTSVDIDALMSARAEFDATRRRLLDEARTPSVLAATAVAAAAGRAHGASASTSADTEPLPDDGMPDDGNPDDGDPSDADTEPWRRGRAGTSIGRAVHATLQTVDLATGADLGAIAAAHAAAEGIPGRTAEVERSARAALRSPIVAAAAALPHWRELYVGAAIDGVLCEGYLDLLVDGPDGLVVIDYKTDRAPDPAALVPRYRLQTATYALLVEATTGRPVQRCVLVALGPNGATEVEIPDLDQARDDVRRLVVATGRQLP